MDSIYHGELSVPYKTITINGEDYMLIALQLTEDELEALNESKKLKVAISGSRTKMIISVLYDNDNDITEIEV